MNTDVVKKNVLDKIEKAPLVQLKINPECLDLVNNMKLYYKFRSINELVTHIFNDKPLSKSSSTLEASLISRSLGSNLTQAIKIFEYFLESALVNNNAETLKDFEKLRKAVSANDEFECKSKLIKIVSEIPEAISRVVNANVRLGDDSSPMILDFKKKIKSLDIHQNAPKRKNIWIRLDMKTYRRFFKRQVSSADPFNRRAFWIGLKEKTTFVTQEIDPEVLLQIRSIHDDINNCNTLMNEVMKKKGKVGVFDTYKTYAKVLITLNKIAKEG